MRITCIDETHQKRENSSRIQPSAWGPRSVSKSRKVISFRWYRSTISIPALSVRSLYSKSRELAESRYFGKSHKSMSLLKASEIGRARCSLPFPRFPVHPFVPFSRFSYPLSPVSSSPPFPAPSRRPHSSAERVLRAAPAKRAHCRVLKRTEICNRKLQGQRDCRRCRKRDSRAPRCSQGTRARRGGYYRVYSWHRTFAVSRVKCPGQIWSSWPRRQKITAIKYGETLRDGEFHAYNRESVGLPGNRRIGNIDFICSLNVTDASVCPQRDSNPFVAFTHYGASRLSV